MTPVKKMTPNPVKTISNAELNKLVEALTAQMAQLFEEVARLRETLYAAPSPAEARNYASTINRVEEFNGEEATAPRDEDGMKMRYADKIQSMLNAVKILPPNMVENGRHTLGNVSAICGFKATPEMLDEVYRDFKHDEY